MERDWDGRTVHLAKTNPDHDRRCIELAVTPETAEALRTALQKGALAYALFDPAVGEVLDALSYVLVGHTQSRVAHNRMMAGKGMTPDGGYKQPVPAPQSDEDDARPFGDYARGLAARERYFQGPGYTPNPGTDL